MARVVLCALVLLLAAACGNDGEPTDGVGESTSPQIEPQPAPEAITEDDSGEAFGLALGEETNLRLASEWTWDEPRVVGGAVQLQRVDYLLDPGFMEWIVIAIAPGTATIAAVGTPACEGQDGCADEPLPFQATIAVTE